MAGVYIHIPFCTKACHYCDFHFSTSLKTKNALLEGVKKEIHDRQPFFSTEEKIETIYFGGGTPSILTPTEINEILETVKNTFTVVVNPEITLEANPEHLTESYSKEIKPLVNRLSVGIQTFNEEALTFLNRSHNSYESFSALENIKKAGFENVSLDLIYGIQSLSFEDFLFDYQRLLEFEPQHLSVYNLTIEEDTVFGKWLSKGKIEEVNDSLSGKMYSFLMEDLPKQGFQQYEISNFAQEGFYSKHNNSYWENVPFLGIGPSAHSFNGKDRFYNVANNAAYIKGVNSGEEVTFKEEASKSDRINDSIMVGLRTSKGLDLKKLKVLGATLNPETVEQFYKKEFLITEGDYLKLTNKGKLFADQVAMEFFVDKDI